MVQFFGEGNEVSKFYGLEFKQDYVIVHCLEGCPGCHGFPFSLVLPALLGKVNVVAAFHTAAKHGYLDTCAEGMIKRELVANGVTIVFNGKEDLEIKQNEHMLPVFETIRVYDMQTTFPSTFGELLNVTERVPA